jgi:glycosyltransferase involved in cell wall biosynthesis
VTINLANSLADRGYEVDYVAGTLEGEFVSEIGEDVRVVDLNVSRIPVLGILAAIPHLRSYLKSNRPDVLFVERTHTSIPAIFAAIFSDIDVHVAPTVHYVHSHSVGIKSKLMKRVAARLWTVADDVIAVSEGVAKDIAESTDINERNITVLHNSIDIEKIQSMANETIGQEWLTSDDIRSIVSVGRLGPQKDRRTLLKSFAELTDTYPDTRLIIVGKGSQRENLESFAKSLHIDEKVDFRGFVENQYAYMKQGSVFVLSSKHEALPTVLMEALACGCSIVSTDCQYGPREILCGETYGRLTPVGDSSEMAATIGEALEDPIEAELATSRAEHFSLRGGAERYDEYIEEVVTGH